MLNNCTLVPTSLHTSWLHRYLCAYRLGPVLEVLRMLDAQVPMCLSVVLKCWMFCCWKSCANTLYAIPSSLQTSWPPRYLCACLLVGLKCWKFCCWKSCANTLYAIPSSLQKSWLHRYLLCVSVGLMCWRDLLTHCMLVPSSLHPSWLHRYLCAYQLG